MKSLRELLAEKFNEDQDYGVIPDAELEEVLRESFPVVWTGDEDTRRWRIDYYNVCKIVDDGVERYFKYSACKGTNDNSWEDAGYEFEGIESVDEVFPREVTTIVYE